MQIPEALKRYTEACVQGGAPPCTQHCPLGFDIKNFLSKLEKGNFSAAYRAYQKRTVFPAIVSRICAAPCMGACSASLSMPLLERACILYARSQAPEQYHLPKRSERIAVVGAGLSGLACAQRLAAKKYDVTVFEREAALAGSLRGLLPADVYQEELERQLSGAPCRLELGTRIDALEPLFSRKDGAFDAVYIATGPDGNAFGVASLGEKSVWTAHAGVFLGGRVLYGGHVEAVAQGTAAAAAIEAWLKLGDAGVCGSEGSRQSCVSGTDARAADSPPLIPQNGHFYTQEEAAAEARRCLFCDCTICYEACPFMREQGLMPKEIELKAMSGREATNERIGSRMIASCALCGHCEAACDFGVSVEKAMRRAKAKLFADGGFAPCYHDFYLRELDEAMGDFFLSFPYSAAQKPGSYVFFPGCQAAMTNPEYVLKPYRYMLEKDANTTLFLACCGIPALYAGDEEKMRVCHDKLTSELERLGNPVLVLSCPSCVKTFSEFLPQHRFVSLYEYILEHGLPEDATRMPGNWALFDPCASRNFPGLQEAVRCLLEQLEISFSELPENREHALCCGMGGHIYAANPALSRRFTQIAAAQSAHPYLAYCVNCQERFLAEEKAASSIMDVLFGLAPSRRPAHLHERRQNRMRLWKALGLASEEAEAEGEALYPLQISEELLKKLDRLLLSVSDIQKVVACGEGGDGYLLSEKSGTRIASAKIGLVTVWAEYRRSGAGTELLNAYSHRIDFET